MHSSCPCMQLLIYSNPIFICNKRHLIIQGGVTPVCSVLPCSTAAKVGQDIKSLDPWLSLKLMLGLWLKQSSLSHWLNTNSWGKILHVINFRKLTIKSRALGKFWLWYLFNSFNSWPTGSPSTLFDLWLVRFSLLDFWLRLWPRSQIVVQ